MRKVLITGGAGFIGSHVSQALFQNGFEVRSYDLLPSKIEKIESIQGDILNQDLLGKALQGCDAIVHLAAQISVPRSLDYPEETMEINVKGTQNVLAAAKKHGIKRIVLASSAAVYGDSTNLPLNEESLGNILSPYASSKLKNEEQAILAREDGLETVALRFFNVYGPHQSSEGPYVSVIPKISEKIIRGEKPIIYGDGFQTRDFIHVSDVALSILKILTLDWNDTFSPVYNIATQNQTSLLELVEIINTSCLQLDLIQESLEPIFETSRKGDIRHSLASTDRITREIGWKPLIDVKQGIFNLIKEKWVVE